MARLGKLKKTVKGLQTFNIVHRPCVPCSSSPCCINEAEKQQRQDSQREVAGPSLGQAPIGSAGLAVLETEAAQPACHPLHVLAQRFACRWRSSLSASNSTTRSTSCYLMVRLLKLWSRKRKTSKVMHLAKKIVALTADMSKGT